MKKNIALIIILFFLMIPLLTAQQNENKKKPKVVMVQYYFVLLSKGDNRSQPDSVAKKIQEGHMANINKMADDGILLCAGPFGDDKGGGIFIFKTDSIEKVKELCEKDPAIISGRLKYEARP